MKKFIKSIAMLLLVVFPLMFILTACKSRGGGSLQIEDNGEYNVLTGTTTEFEINKETGFLKSIKRGAVEHKSENSGAWPFRFTLGGNVNKTVQIAGSSKSVADTVTKTTQDNYDIYTYVYNNLTAEDYSSTGVKATVKYYFNAIEDYLSFDVEFDTANMNASTRITQLWLAYGGSLKSGAEPANSTLIVPTWGEGTSYKNPVNSFSSHGLNYPVRLGYPANHWTEMAMGFMDYSANDGSGGIGIGYINKKEMLMNFEMAVDDGGMSISPGFLKTTMKNALNYEISASIGRGEIFSTDRVLVVPHSGDWHSFGDVYRTEFYKTFVNQDKTRDYLTYNDLADDVKKTNAFFQFQAPTTFEQILTPSYHAGIPNMLSVFDGYLSMENTMVWYAAQNDGAYGKMLPEVAPTGQKLADLQGFSAYINDRGGSVFYYMHPFAFDTSSSNSVWKKNLYNIRDADPGLYGCPIGWGGTAMAAVCMSSPELDPLWDNYLMPQLRQQNAGGIQFDQSSLQYSINHRGTNAMEILSGHSIGMNKRIKYARENLNPGQLSYVVGESFNDVMNRWLDMPSSRWMMDGGRPFPTINDKGQLVLGLQKFMFPEIAFTSNSAATLSNGVNQDSRILSAITGHILPIGEGQAFTLESARETLGFVKHLKEIKAPGYPYNFRDTLGVTIGAQDKENSVRLEARTFVGGDKITVTFASLQTHENGFAITDGRQSAANITITLDPSKLGFSGAAVKTFTIPKLTANSTGYLIYDVKTGKVESRRLSNQYGNDDGQITMSGETTPQSTPSTAIDLMQPGILGGALNEMTTSKHSIDFNRQTIYGGLSQISTIGYNNAQNGTLMFDIKVTDRNAATDFNLIVHGRDKSYGDWPFNRQNTGEYMMFANSVIITNAAENGIYDPGSGELPLWDGQLHRVAITYTNTTGFGDAKWTYITLTIDGKFIFTARDNSARVDQTGGFTIVTNEISGSIINLRWDTSNKYALSDIEQQVLYKPALMNKIDATVVDNDLTLGTVGGANATTTFFNHIDYSMSFKVKANTNNGWFGVSLRDKTGINMWEAGSRYILFFNPGEGGWSLKLNSVGDAPVAPSFINQASIFDGSDHDVIISIRTGKDNVWIRLLIDGNLVGEWADSNKTNVELGQIKIQSSVDGGIELKNVVAAAPNVFDPTFDENDYPTYVEGNFPPICFGVISGFEQDLKGIYTFTNTTNPLPNSIEVKLANGGTMMASISWTASFDSSRSAIYTGTVCIEGFAYEKYFNPYVFVYVQKQ